MRRARNAQCPWYWSTTTSKSQEFGGLQPRDERSRHPSLGLPRVSAESDTGRPIFSGPANWWRKCLAHSSRSKLAARASRCQSPLQALARASQAERTSRSPASASRCSCPSPERKVGRRQARHVCPTCDCGAHQQLVDPLDARVTSAAFTLAMSARATSSPAGVGRTGRALSAVGPASRPRLVRVAPVSARVASWKTPSRANKVPTRS